MIANRIIYTSKHLPLFTVQSKAGCVRAGKMFLVSVSLACLKIRMCHIKVTQIQQKNNKPINKEEKKTVFFFFLRENKDANFQIRVRVQVKCLTGGEAGWSPARRLQVLTNTWAASSSGAAAGRQQSGAPGPGGCLQGLLGAGGCLRVTPPPAGQSESLPVFALALGLSHGTAGCRPQSFISSWE